MDLNLYAIFDRKSDCYHAPFAATNDGTAIRHVTLMMGDPENIVYAQFPEDFILCKVGHYKTATAEIIQQEIAARPLFEFRSARDRNGKTAMTITPAEGGK